MLTDREKLLMRLSAVADAAVRPLVAKGYVVGTAPFDEALFAGLTDEVFRQIKWAWHAARWANPETMSWEATVLEDGQMDCGLAPDDWEVK
jgi:hypothetical protein